jgi:hypothetical protein
MNAARICFRHECIALRSIKRSFLVWIGCPKWYRAQARAELARLTGPHRKDFERTIGPEALADQIATWTAMIPVVETGEHCPHHFRGRKP